MLRARRDITGSVHTSRHLSTATHGTTTQARNSRGQTPCTVHCVPLSLRLALIRNFHSCSSRSQQYWNLYQLAIQMVTTYFICYSNCTKDVPIGYTIHPLAPGNQYSGPTTDTSTQNACKFSSTVFSILADLKIQSVLSRYLLDCDIQTRFSMRCMSECHLDQASPLSGFVLSLFTLILVPSLKMEPLER